MWGENVHHFLDCIRGTSTTLWYSIRHECCTPLALVVGKMLAACACCGEDGAARDGSRGNVDTAQVGAVCRGEDAARDGSRGNVDTAQVGAVCREEARDGSRGNVEESAFSCERNGSGAMCEMQSKK